MTDAVQTPSQQGASFAPRVFSGIRQYPENTFGPRTCTLPISPTLHGVPSSRRTRTPTPGSGSPTVVFEAGGGNNSTTWTVVSPSIADCLSSIIPSATEIPASKLGLTSCPSRASKPCSMVEAALLAMRCKLAAMWPRNSVGSRSMS